MSIKILNSAIIAGLLLAAGMPIVASAADAAAPKTKAACEKVKNMKWDDTSKACVKK
jgi:ABC-type Fe2+-enterobactin transport system substrate-binding protein